MSLWEIGKLAFVIFFSQLFLLGSISCYSWLCIFKPKHNWSWIALAWICFSFQRLQKSLILILLKTTLLSRHLNLPLFKVQRSFFNRFMAFVWYRLDLRLWYFPCSHGEIGKLVFVLFFSQVRKCFGLLQTLYFQAKTYWFWTALALVSFSFKRVQKSLT